jgi:hypothetical protein
MQVEDLTKEVLERLYLQEGMTESEIAALYGTYQMKVSRLRKAWGIPTLGKTGRITKALPPLTELQRELLTGSLLGDGYMVESGGQTARFAESHGESQSEYLLWKKGLLEAYALTTTVTEKRDGDKVFRGLRLNGVSCEALREFYDLFYPVPDRKRKFPADLYKRMTPFVLAVWYMDDGSLAKGCHPRISFGLDEESLGHALRALRKLRLSPVVHQGHGAWDITFPGQSDKFFRLVGPHVPACMNYKLPSSSERREADRNAKRLTADRARVLYEGGMSFADIARMFDVGRSTARRRVAGSSLTVRKGRPKSRFDRRAADVALAEYTPARWAALGEDQKITWVDEVLAVLRRTPFPVPLELSDEEFEKDVVRVRGTSMRLEGDTIVPWITAGSRACLPFFPNRYRAASRGVRTAYEAWHDDEVLRWAIRFQLDHGDPVLPHRVLRAVTMQHRTPSVFRSTVARWIYDTYCPAGGTVWDPCAGYGGRLLGAATSSKVGRYVGTDVEPETVDGNNRLAAQLGASHCRVELHRAEEYDPGPVSLVFTSPPYFDREQYSTSAAQSWVQHGSSLDAWVDGFLRPIIRTARSRLPADGVLVLNVADIKHGRRKHPLVARAIEAAQSTGFQLAESLWMPLARINRTADEAREPVLVFRPV